MIRNEWMLSLKSIEPSSDLFQEVFDFLDSRHYAYFEPNHAFDENNEIIYPQLYGMMLVERLESLLLLC